GLERAAREAQSLPVIDTGHTFVSPTGGDPLALLISPVVDGRFGATAVLGIPERDSTDAMIAQRLFGEQEPSSGGSDVATADGRSTHTPLRQAVRYKSGDFSVSRQRSWGTPIPIVYCEQCGTVPVPAEQLPVQLPRDLIPTGEGNPLAAREDFVNTTCPTCGEPAKRETDTLDCHFDALWLWVPVCVPQDERERSLEEILALDDLRTWLPCERVVAGSDSGNFVFDQRIITKALRDIGPLAFLSEGECFAGCLFHEMVIRDGRKMSKHLGNVVDPDELVARYGADTVRLAVLYAARPQKSLNWSDSAVTHCHRFLGGLWRYYQACLAIDTDQLQDSDAQRTEHLRVRLAMWCETGAQKITEDLEQLETHSAVRNVMRLFERIRGFEKRVLDKRGELSREDLRALLSALRLLLAMLAPLAPHISEQLWIDAGWPVPSGEIPWPKLAEVAP
ncbi:MAG: class I tRNA ligase family protein, partial [Solirubrobacteraceae bacterium]